MIAEINELITNTFEYSFFIKYNTNAIPRFINIVAGITIIKAIETLGSGSFSLTQNQIMM
jgi:hypothetical protein